MSFTDALKELLDGKRVTRKKWEDKRHYALMEDYILQIHKAGEEEGLNHPWILQEEDMLADDWIVL